jgi:Uma2 family endonuclease
MAGRERYTPRMVRASIPRKSLSIEEYLEIEERSSARHKFVGGELFTRGGTTERHDRIATNIVNCLAVATQSGPCRVLAADVKLQVANDLIYYPDVMVVCDREDADSQIKTRPCLIVEIESPATATADRREKVMAYCRILSLAAYLIVSQDARHVVRHWRDSKGAWWREQLVGEGSMRLTCPHTELQFGQIYKGIDFTDASLGHCTCHP